MEVVYIKLYVNDIKHLENYLALWICIKGVIKIDKNKEYTIDELRALPREYLNTCDALKLMGLDVKECKKVVFQEEEEKGAMTSEEVKNE